MPRSESHILVPTFVEVVELAYDAQRKLDELATAKYDHKTADDWANDGATDKPARSYVVSPNEHAEVHARLPLRADLFRLYRGNTPGNDLEQLDSRSVSRQDPFIAVRFAGLDLTSPYGQNHPQGGIVFFGEDLPVEHDNQLTDRWQLRLNFGQLAMINVVEKLGDKVISNWEGHRGLQIPNELHDD